MCSSDLASLEAGVKNVVYAASSSCYGNPTEVPTTENAKVDPLNPYAYQKYLGEEYCEMFSKVYDLPTSCLRIFNPFGDRSYHPQMQDAAYSSVVGIFLHRREIGLPLLVTGEGQQRRDFVYVGDVAHAFFLAGCLSLMGERINVGIWETVSIVELAEQVGAPYEFIPPRPGEAEITCANIEKAGFLLNWQPTTKLSDYVNEKTRNNR